MDVLEMLFPDGAGIHNGTSSIFARTGASAKVHLPHGPEINLPFTNASDFMRIMKWRMQDYPAVEGKDAVGAPIRIESENPEQARDLILQGAIS